jgi:hypothetical protein
MNWKTETREDGKHYLVHTDGSKEYEVEFLMNYFEDMLIKYEQTLWIEVAKDDEFEIVKRYKYVE